ncbi:MAG TPA: DNA repair protein RecO [Mycobacteriales bacterium]|nr:DNA repair protein RecO [Mycobacteriales bacterium]
MSLYRDEAVVLRLHKLGEADRIVTLLTRRYGRVRAVAKGVRRTTSKFGARLEPFSHVDVQLWTGRNLDIVTQAESITAYGADLVADYPGYTAGSAVLETAERLTGEEREPSLRLYLLVLGALRTLVAGEHEPRLVLDAFLVRSMAVAGWQPALTECAQCAAPGPHRAFSVPVGGAVCSDCRPRGSVLPAPETFDLLQALLAGQWAVADASQPAARQEASGLLAAHLQWHLERGLRSLPLVERDRPAHPRSPSGGLPRAAVESGRADSTPVEPVPRESR